MGDTREGKDENNDRYARRVKNEGGGHLVGKTTIEQVFLFYCCLLRLAHLIMVTLCGAGRRMQLQFATLN